MGTAKRAATKGKTAKAKPKTAKKVTAKPKTAKAKPKTAKAKPKVAKAKPKKVTAKPKVAKAKPKTAKAKPKTAKAKPKTAKPKVARPITDDGPVSLFVDAVREHDFPCKDALDGWKKTRLVTLMLAWLLGVPPTPTGRKALARLFEEVGAELSERDRSGVASARALLERAARGSVAEKNRAAFDLAGMRDEAILAQRPALASFVDALAHAAEASASHADGDHETPLRRGIEVGRALLYTLAEHRAGDGEDREVRAEVSGELAAKLRAALPGGPA